MFGDLSLDVWQLYQLMSLGRTDGLRVIQLLRKSFSAVLALRGENGLNLVDLLDGH
jgi:hypothetical protein